MAIHEQEKIELPPSPFIREVADRLCYGQLDILDVGCSIGRNALYLAGLGHNVVAIDTNIDELSLARGADPSVSLVAADVRRLPFRKQFDVVLMNEVLQLIPEPDRKSTLSNLKSVTRPHGFNAVSGYIGNKPGALQPRELYAAYAGPAWEILDYKEDEEAVIRFGGKTELTSLARILAVKK